MSFHESNVEFSFEIKTKCGVISRTRNGWTKELNYVAWNNNEPRYELRNWSHDHSRMGRGITLNPIEILRLHNFLGAVINDMLEAGVISEEVMGEARLEKMKVS